MVLEITLDLSEAAPAAHPDIQKCFQQWATDFSLKESAEVLISQPLKGRHKKLCHSVLFDGGDIIATIQDLHKRMYDSGVNIFVDFVHENGSARGQS